MFRLVPRLNVLLTLLVLDGDPCEGEDDSQADDDEQSRADRHAHGQRDVSHVWHLTERGSEAPGTEQKRGSKYTGLVSAPNQEFYEYIRPMLASPAAVS